MKILKHFLLAILGLGILFASLYLEDKTAKATQTLVAEPITVLEKAPDTQFNLDKDGGYTLQSGSGSFVLQIHETSLLKFAKETSARITLQEAPELLTTIELEKGRVWSNTLNSERTVILKAKNISATEFPGIFDAALDSANLILTSIRRGLRIKFLKNELILPESRQIVIAESKLKNSGEVIAKLRYSKLSKEFPFFSIEGQDEWIASNMENDAAFADMVRKKFTGQIRKQGQKISESGSFWNRISISFTFNPETKEKKQASFVNDHLDTAAYYVLLGNNEASEKFLLAFKNLTLEAGSNKLLAANLIDSLDDFSFASPLDPFFRVKLMLREQVRATGFQLISSLDDIFDISASGEDQETRTRVLAGLRQFGATLASKLNTIQNSQTMFFEYIRFNDFLRVHPELITEEFLKISELYENSSLALTKNEDEANDMREYLIGEKLKNIKIVSDRLEKGDIEYLQARPTVLFVASQIDELRSKLTGTAVLAYFENQLMEIAPLVAYLRSESGEHMKGNFRENFDSFLARKEEVKRVQGLLRGSQGGMQISAFRREELAAEISEDFGEAGISNVKIILPDQENDPRVRVTSATLEGKNFTALYDTVRKVFSEVELSNEKIPNAIRLDQFRKFVLAKSGKLSLPKGTSADSLTVSQSPQSLLEKVSKTTLIEDLKKSGITIDEKYLGMENFADDVIHVRLAFLGDGSDAVIFSFDVSEKLSLAKNLVVQTVLGEVPVNDEFALRELADRVRKVYELSSLEQQKEEEMERLLEEEIGG